MSDIADLYTVVRDSDTSLSSKEAKATKQTTLTAEVKSVEEDSETDEWDFQDIRVEELRGYQGEGKMATKSTEDFIFERIEWEELVAGEIPDEDMFSST